MQEDIVLCKIYRKATSLKILEERAAMEDVMAKTVGPISSSPQSQEIPEESLGESLFQYESVASLPMTKEENQELVVPFNSTVQFGCLNYNGNLKTLQVPEVPKFGMDLTTDALLTQLRSPWLEHWSPGAFANLLNY